MTEREEEAIEAISKSTKVTVALASAMLVAAVTVAWRIGSIVSDIDVRQTRMEERQIAAQAITNERLGSMGEDIKDIADSLKDGLRDGNSERASMVSRIGALEHEVIGLSRRVSDLETKK